MELGYYKDRTDPIRIQEPMHDFSDLNLDNLESFSFVIQFSYIQGGQKMNRSQFRSGRD